MMIIHGTATAVLLMLLTACTTTPVIKQQPVQHLLETEKLAATAYENSDWQDSEKYYLILIEKDPGQSLYWLRLGNIYSRTNRPDAAIVAYREALVRDSGLTNAWFNMGIIQLKQATYSLNEMQLHVDPEDPVAIQSRKLLEGILELIQGDNSE